MQFIQVLTDVTAVFRLFSNFVQPLKNLDSRTLRRSVFWGGVTHSKVTDRDIEQMGSRNVSW